MELFGLSEPIVRLIAFAVNLSCRWHCYELLSPRLERDELDRRSEGAALVHQPVDPGHLVDVAAGLFSRWQPLARPCGREEKGYGLFHVLDIPVWLAGIIAFAVLDFAVWLEHVVKPQMFHILWRIHRMHHCDPGFDLTTALRFPPA